MCAAGRALEAERHRLQQRAAEASKAALQPASSMDEPSSPPQRARLAGAAQGLTPRRALQQEAEALRSQLQAGPPAASCTLVQSGWNHAGSGQMGFVHFAVEQLC